MFRFYKIDHIPKFLPLKRGNKKIGKDTIILNFETALFCSANRLNLCKVRDICYSLRSEIFHYNSTIQYRRRQELFFKYYDSFSIAQEIKKYVDINCYNIEYVRFSEGGDFPDQNLLNKFIGVCELLPQFIFYGYTSRSDLDFSKRPNNMIVNGSGFMIDNSFTVVNEFNDHDLECSVRI